MKKAFRTFGGLKNPPMFENLHDGGKKQMKIFSLDGLNSSTAVMVFLLAPKIQEVAETDITKLREIMAQKSGKTLFRKKAIRYEYCQRLLEYVHNCDKQAKVRSVYNLPSRGGNKIAFILAFATSQGKKEFLEGLSDLDDELSDI